MSRTTWLHGQNDTAVVYSLPELFAFCRGGVSRLRRARLRRIFDLRPRPYPNRSFLRQSLGGEGVRRGFGLMTPAHLHPVTGWSSEIALNWLGHYDNCARCEEAAHRALVSI